MNKIRWLEKSIQRARRSAEIDNDFHFRHYCGSPRSDSALIVCHCHRVCDRTIRRAVRNGAVSPEEVARACGAGAGCGGCSGAVEDVVRQECEAHALHNTLRPVETLSLS